MKIVVTGGAGYIGSHTCIELIEAGHTVIIVDNLCNSQEETIERIKQITRKNITYYLNDVTDESAINTIFSKHRIDAIIHFAGLKAVGESVEKPLEYYYNNIVSTLVLAKACQKFGVRKFVFSSSATVYGGNQVPFIESMQLQPTTNPYGETKAVSERILSDIVKANSDWAVAILRYFNPIGAHESGLIGEAPNGIPNNLMPYITQVAKGKLDKLRVFGGDYETVDGTGIRDYIHVCDLAMGHVAALDKLTRGVHIYNLGTGKGASVLQLVHEFEKVNSIYVPYEIEARRPGDIPECYADASKAQRELGWKAKRNLEDMCRDAWRFEQNYSELVPSRLSLLNGKMANLGWRELFDEYNSTAVALYNKTSNS
ncbi:UDP-glucose 4-epimerase GalE [Desulfosporosinus sp. HMP52]|uniref:UDP-glucose 4-epimerase GalE n=1 Tax=Desulfosporosinus sp. HMP52 TaxID=1487923 RepID=UPI0009E0A86E|nr:UDP-glucose 4-epimerase GalE [Desulfosporosinus sp. HMP52]